MFDLSVGELLIISLVFITITNCALTYFCCTKSLKILDVDKSISKAVNKLRIFDQYLLSKINLIVAIFYFGLSYIFVDTFLKETNYIFFLSCLLSFVLTLFTTFISRLCYCYTCNVLLDTTLNEIECLIVNFKRLLTIYVPFFIISLLVPSIYLFNIGQIYKNIIAVVSLMSVLIIWVVLTPKIMILNLNAKKVTNSLLKHRLELLMDTHNIKKYNLYYWDTSKSKESNAYASGITTYSLFISSYLLEEVTLPELETIVTHEIGHIKNNHIIKMMMGKIFVLFSVLLLFLSPYLFNFEIINKGLLYMGIVSLIILSILISLSIERKYEVEADAYASYYNDSELFTSALRKITKDEIEENNKLDQLFQTHPDIRERIENIKKS